MYFVDGRLLGHEIDWQPYPRSLDGFELAYLLAGKVATFCIVSNDGRVNRAVAIRFATAIFNGTFKTFTTDLTKWGMKNV